MNKHDLVYEKMRGAYINLMNYHSYSVQELYLTLEKIFDECYKQGLVKEGYEFICDVGCNVALRFVFYKDITELYSTNLKQKDEPEGCLVSRDMPLRYAANKETSTLLGYERALKDMGLHIAKTAERSFFVALNKLKPGVVVAFTEGKMYVCRENKDLKITLDRVFDGDIKNINPSAFVKTETIELDLTDSISVQRFYNQNAKNLTWSCEVEYAVLSDCIKELEGLKRGISRFQSKAFQVGPVSFVGKKSVWSNHVKWYDNTGAQITDEQLSYLIGLLHTQPITTKYIRKEPTFEKIASDEEFRLKIERLLDDKQYDLAYQEMLKYSKTHTNDLIIKTDGFLRNNKNEYIAGSIVFRDGQAFQLSYEDNDLSKDVVKTSELNKSDFIALCQCKYTETYERVFAKAAEEIEKEYHLKLEDMTATQKRIVKQQVEKEMDKTSGIILKKENIMSGTTDASDIINEMSEDNSINILLQR
ncbi:MAG: hypothetical protein E7260_09575 [Lachnospiraceae bacterium]|nr:hypothetical protein [Lachnospiraceae bacterium]